MLCITQFNFKKAHKKTGLYFSPTYYFRHAEAEKERRVCLPETPSNNCQLNLSQLHVNALLRIVNENAVTRLLRSACCPTTKKTHPHKKLEVEYAFVYLLVFQFACKIPAIWRLASVGRRAGISGRGRGSCAGGPASTYCR